MNVTNVRQVLPPVTKATFQGLGSEELDMRASNWGWTHLKTEVYPMLRSRFAQMGATGLLDFGLSGDPDNNIPDLRADDIFGRYGYLNDIRDGRPLHTWTNMSDVTVIHGERPEHPPMNPEYVYIPHAWATSAVAAADHGIVRVTTVSSHCSPIHIIHYLIAMTVDGVALEAVPDNKRDGGFVYLPPQLWLDKLIKEQLA